MDRRSLHGSFVYVIDRFVVGKLLRGGITFGSGGKLVEQGVLLGRGGGCRGGVSCLAGVGSRWDKVSRL